MLEGIVHLKMKMLSSFTFPHFVSHLYSFLSCVEHKISYFEAQGGVKFTGVLLILFGKIRLFQIGNAIENLA